MFFGHDPVDLHEEDRHFTLTPEEIAMINPNTKTCPIFRSKRDAEITKSIYRRVPVLINENEEDGNPWGIQFMRMFDMSNDSHLFKTREELESDGYRLEGNHFVKDEDRYLPLYEAKMFHQFDHRFATYQSDGTTKEVTANEKSNVNYVIMPRYWVNAELASQKLVKKDGKGNIIWEWNKSWLMGWRDITNSTNERTFIATIYPRVAAGDTFLQMLSQKSTSEIFCLIGNINSFCCDYVARQKIGGMHLKYHVTKQIAIISPEQYSDYWLKFISTRVHYLQNISTDLWPNEPKHIWNESNRELVRAELDASFFHLYSIGKDDVDYIMETFPIVKRKDEQEYGEYRTKRLILEIYDEMQQAIETGVPYESKVPLGEEETRKPAIAHPIAPEEKEEPKEPTPFDEAILISALVREISSDEFPMGNFRIQKFTYLVHRAEQSNVLRSYYKHAAGPYNPSLKYQGPFNIALDNGYIREHEYQKRTGFITGPDITNIDKYLSRRSFNEALDWVVETFKYVKSAKLELLTTVDYAILELTEQGEGITIDSIKTFIASDEEWAPKLQRKIFSDRNIKKAIGELRGWFRYERGNEKIK